MPVFAERFLLTISCPNCGATMRLKYAKGVPDELLYMCETEGCSTALWWDSPMVLKLAGVQEEEETHGHRGKRAR